MFYNTKIRALFVTVYVLQHIFDQKLYFIDLSQKNIAFYCILVTLLLPFLFYNIYIHLFILEKVLYFVISK